MREPEVIKLLKGIFGGKSVHRFIPGPYSIRGIADCLIVSNNFNYFCEIKMNNTSVTLNQKRFLASISCPILLRVIERKKKIIIHAEEGSYYPKEMLELRNIISLKKGGIWEIESKDISEILTEKEETSA